MGPLAGVRIVEMAGIGPAPFCGMLLAELGAEVLRVDRLTAAADLGIDVERRFDLPNRSKRAIAVDLKRPEGVALVSRLVGSADALIEGFRPGVMERLGLGPEPCLAANPRLVYGRMTGWGQEGPLSQRVGHDINYIAMAGALDAIGPAEGGPLPPLNLVGDFGGGALYLAMGLLAGIIEARGSGQGQVVDAAMVDGAASLMAMFHGFRQAGLWQAGRGANVLDGGAPYYATYRTSDGRYVAVGAIEKRFYAALLEGLGLEAAALPAQDDRSRWADLRQVFAATFATRTRDDWAAHFEGRDACVSPVLTMEESLASPMARARAMAAETDDVVGPAPAPRFTRTPGAVRHGPLDPRTDTYGALRSWGVDEKTLAELARIGVIPAAA
ncbi:CaiB/BaiF CoA-transferase family protein [uncultured Alsobacter sp.]|uniref:CaiB/BaiF CoA transferase family protein n=1 Tax=uncultured Alsobacter sp. TaxID=1748258 RepID=UPI0025EC778F|nr:CaiB/BaiF CoA-transferase family protein [uncultured Alsobacter sp.]